MSRHFGKHLTSEFIKAFLLPQPVFCEEYKVIFSPLVLEPDIIERGLGKPTAFNGKKEAIKGIPTVLVPLNVHTHTHTEHVYSRIS